MDEYEEELRLDEYDMLMAMYPDDKIQVIIEHPSTKEKKRQHRDVTREEMEKFKDSRWILQTTLLPKTESSDELHYVFMTVSIHMRRLYPVRERLECHIDQSRGLSDAMITQIEHGVQKIASQALEDQQICCYEILEYIMDILTEENRHGGDCGICLNKLFYPLNVRVFRTSCWHSFHLDCMTQWFHYSSQQFQDKQRESSSAQSILNHEKQIQTFRLNMEQLQTESRTLQLDARCIEGVLSDLQMAIKSDMNNKENQMIVQDQLVTLMNSSTQANPYLKLMKQCKLVDLHEDKTETIIAVEAQDRMKHFLRELKYLKKQKSTQQEAKEFKAKQIQETQVLGHEQKIKKLQLTQASYELDCPICRTLLENTNIIEQEAKLVQPLVHLEKKDVGSDQSRTYEKEMQEIIQSWDSATKLAVEKTSAYHAKLWQHQQQQQQLRLQKKQNTD